MLEIVWKITTKNSRMDRKKIVEDRFFEVVLFV